MVVHILRERDRAILVSFDISTHRASIRPSYRRSDGNVLGVISSQHLTERARMCVCMYRVYHNMSVPL